MVRHSREIYLLLHLCFPIVLFAATALGQGVNEVSSLPIINIHPRGDVVDLGGSIVLQCGAINTNLPYLFTHNGARINENDPSRIISSSGLTIPNFVAGFEGEYVCLARNRVGNDTFTVASAPALVQLRVLEATLFSSDHLAPYTVTIRVGQPAVIDCASSYTSIPSPTFDWEIYRPFRRQIQESDDMVIGLNGSLYIRNPTEALNQTGFQCTITNSPTIQVGYVQIFIDASTSPAARPRIMSPPMDVTLVLRPDPNTANFECIVGGSPLLAVTWTTPVPQRRIHLNEIYDNNRLQAYNLQPSDAGTFTCSVASSSVGNFSAQLIFIVTPSLSSGLPGTTQVIDYGDPLTLNCASDSVAISWFWFRNGTRLDQFSGPQLTIASTVEEDSGPYQCYIVNEAGRVADATYVQVRTIGAAITQGLPPQKVIFRGSSVSLSCTASGAPPPTYQWIKDGVPLGESSAQFQVNSETGSLIIASVDDSHSGVYTCQATNRIGERVIGQAETNTTLTVIKPTAFTRSLDSEPTLSILLETEDTLFCDVSSDSGSILQFSWTKDSLPLMVDDTRLRYINSRNGSIRITRVLNEDAGVYVCTVTTTYNGLPAPTIGTRSTRVIVTDRPVAPTITEVSSPSPTSLQVIWSITSNLNLIQSFIIEFRLSSSTTGEENSWRQIQRNPNAVTLYIIEDLAPFTAYEVRVSAVYISGGSEAVISDAMEVVTMEDLPGGPPKEVTVVAVPGSDTALEIKWQPPSQPNGLITNYTILYRLKESPTTTNFTATASGNSTLFILKDLKPQGDYFVQVAASNSVGMGPFSVKSLATAGAGGLREPQGPFYQTVWFIVVVTVVFLVLIVGIVILLLVIKYKRTHRPSTGKYHVRPQSAYFGGGGVVDLTDDAVNDYLKRTEMNAFSSPTNSETLDAMLERETVATTLTDHSMPYPSSRGTPQLPNGPARYIGYTAPEYINPPSFTEATRNKRASRPQSTASSTDKSPMPSEWTSGHQSRTGFGYTDPFEKGHFGGGGDDSGPDSSYSVQTYSDRDSVVTDGTEYSHLAGVGQYPRTYHHLQVQAPQNATLV